MTTRVENIGGANWAIGNILTEDDINNTFDVVPWLMHAYGGDASMWKKTFNSSVGYTQTTGSYAFTAGIIHRFKNFVITAGSIGATAGSCGDPLIILVDGSVSIGGTINLTSAGPSGGAAGAANAVGEIGRHYSGATYLSAIIGSYGYGAGSGAVITAGTQPSYGGSPTTFNDYAAGDLPNTMKNLFNAWPGGGGGGGGGGTNAAGGAGGNAGGVLILLSRGDMTIAGSIISRGGNGTAGADGGAGATGGGGGGGGAGGCVILGCGGTYSRTGIINICGGSGAKGGAAGTGSGGGGGAGGTRNTAGLIGANGGNTIAGSGGHGGSGTSYEFTF